MSTKYFGENMNIPIYETALPFFHQNVWAQLLYSQNILKRPKTLTAKWYCHAGKALLETILDNGDENESVCLCTHSQPISILKQQFDQSESSLERIAKPYNCQLADTG